MDRSRDIAIILSRMESKLEQAWELTNAIFYSALPVNTEDATVPYSEQEEQDILQLLDRMLCDVE